MRPLATNERPVRRAQLAASSARFCTSNVRNTLLRLAFTVCVLMNNSAATCRLVLPSATRAATCASVALSWSERRLRPTRSSSSSARRAQRTAPDRAKRSAADSSARRAPTFSRRRRRIWPSARRVRPRSIGRSTRSSWANAVGERLVGDGPVTLRRGKHGSAARTGCQGPRPIELRRLEVPDRQQALGAPEVTKHHKRLDRLRYEVVRDGSRIPDSSIGGMQLSTADHAAAASPSEFSSIARAAVTQGIGRANWWRRAIMIASSASRRARSTSPRSPLTRTLCIST